mmetsp:Transcript_45301/g.116295  ORF Transcript_45301/g.116295 Transcript_45301/m.116295 type:complete len:102 (-) Transcript_45301:19-324(-)
MESPPKASDAIDADVREGPGQRPCLLLAWSASPPLACDRSACEAGDEQKGVDQIGSRAATKIVAKANEVPVDRDVVAERGPRRAMAPRRGVRRNRAIIWNV